MRWFYLLPVSALLFFMLPAAAPGPNNWRDKISPDLLAALERGESVEMLVVMQEQANLSAVRIIRGKAAKGAWVYQTLSSTAKRTQAPVQALLREHGAPFKAFSIVNAVFTRVNIDVARELAGLDAVRQLQPNPWVQMEPAMPDRAYHTGRNLIEWGIERINADDVWALGFNGQDVVVGGQDTGYDWDHPAIMSQYRGWNGAEADHNYNWHDAIHGISPLHGDTTLNPANNPCGIDIDTPCDDNSHGTHTMGTMVGDDGQGNQIGVAPGARWVGVRNMERGWGSPATYLEGFEWFLAPTDLNGANPQPAMAPHVINNSWGCPPVEGCNADNWGIMNQAVNALRAAGIVVVVSAGNSGSSCATVRDPAAIFEGSFSVGATRPNDTIAGFSSRGPVLVDGSLRLKPDVSAPGVSVRSSIPGGGYAAFNGTSMAGPHVAGAVALLISAVPELAGEVDSIEAILRRTAVPKLADQDCEGYLGQQVPNAVYGHGRIDVLAAVLEAQRTITNAGEPDNAEAVRVFPNPAGDWVQLSWGARQQWDKMELFGADGRLALSQQVSGKQWADIPLTALPAGVYLYRLTDRSGNQTTGRIVRQ